LQSILKTYLKRLTNLTTRNRSLLLLNLPAEQFVDVHEFDFLLNKASFDVLRQLMARKAQVPLGEVLDGRFERSNEVSKKLRKLARTEQFILAERGAQDLYVGYPFVRGKFADGTVVRAPLLFFPVTLSQVHSQSPANQWVWALQAREEPVALNRSLLLAYAHFSQVKLPDELYEKNFDEADPNSRVFLTQLYDLLKNTPLKLNFNQALFEEQLIPFERFLKSDLEQLERNGELKLYPEAVLGIFPQAGSYLAPDYEYLLAQPETLTSPPHDALPLAPLFATQLVSSAALPKEEALLNPLPVDASQEQAMLLVKQGASMVVQGPPGTGKSQLISNLMADFAARGKKVLLVCQKRVALDTVYERLRRLGMADFVALVHDFKNDRKALYTQLAAQVERVAAYQTLNYGLDAIFMEREYLQTCRRIDQIGTELKALREVLFDESECGVSVKELYLSHDPTVVAVDLHDYYKTFGQSQWKEFERKLRAYDQYAQRVNTDQHPWQSRVDFGGFQPRDIPRIEVIINEVRPEIARHRQTLSGLSGIPMSWIDCRELMHQRAEISHFVEGTASPLVNDLTYRYLRGDFADAITQDLTKQQVNIKQYEAEGVFEEWDKSRLRAFETLLEQAIVQRDALLGWVFFGGKEEVKQVAEAQGLGTTKRDLVQLKQRIQRRWEVELCVRIMAETLGVTLTALDTYEQIKAQLSSLSVALEQAQQMEQLATEELLVLKEIATESPTDQDFAQGMRVLHKAVEQLSDQYRHWQWALTETQIQGILTDAEMPQQLITSLRRDFDLLCEADTLFQSFSRNEVALIERCGTNTAVLSQSLGQAWIEHIEEKHPILRGVSSLKISQIEEELQQLIVQKQRMSQEILLLQLREHTHKNLERNRLQNIVTYRDLKHQVSKKRNVWPLRKLMEELPTEVFPLVPCWMASPESVSAIFPMQPPTPGQRLFDLVIFDEASQCYAEQGIPALFRGAQVVIAGDSQQLQPSDLYRIRFEDDTLDTPELESESLLNLATRYLPQTQLQGHYRSRSLDLIDFSNRHFYKNSLQLLPHFEDINRQVPALEYRKIEGVWQQSTNEAEAQAVVELLQQLLMEVPHKSIGVVTFNFPQQALIQELLEAAALSSSTTEPIFVKNIENVQGDERDVIVFSVGYAPDTKGRMAMQFGSLNASGGENRLNVAVTRARERVYVLASIWPEQLKVEDTTNWGPKLLKDYLTFALAVSRGQYRPTPASQQSLGAARLLKKQLLNPQGSPQVVEELPFADLTIKEEQQYTSLILTDDDLYFGATNPKEMHAYLPLHLQAKGWPFERRWSREFWRGQLH
jgi:hypothetical protein